MSVLSPMIQSHQTIHPKLTESTETMILDTKFNVPFFGTFLLYVNYFARPNDPNLPTAGVNVSAAGMNYYYNPAFIDSLSIGEVHFLNIHEIMHLLFQHQSRTRRGGYEHKLSNIVQDMIINHIIMTDIKSNQIVIPKDSKGRNSALFIPKEYPDEHVFEILYEYVRKIREDIRKKNKKKEEVKIFQELFMKPQRPFPSEITGDVEGQHEMFLSTLSDRSKKDCENYMMNFVRRVVVSVTNDKPVKLVGHTSSVIPDEEDEHTYNQHLSERRAFLYKEAVTEQVGTFLFMNMLAVVVTKDMCAQTSTPDKFAFILQYEQLADKTLAVQRKNELLKTPDAIDITYETYVLSDQSRRSNDELVQELNTRSIPVPQPEDNTAIMTKLAVLLTSEGKGASEKIIVNDMDSKPAELRKAIANLPQYAPMVNLDRPEAKQALNRRVEYIFDKSFGPGMGGGEDCKSPNRGDAKGYGKNGQIADIDCYDLEAIFEEAEENGGNFMDVHIPDSVSEEMREQIVRETQQRAKSRTKRGHALMDDILGKLQKKRRDYLKEIKRAVSLLTKGARKMRTVTRPSRRGIPGIKGVIKYSTELNVMLDVSGSMTGCWEKALSFVFQKGIVINLIQIDTAISKVEKIKSMQELEAVRIKGGGGTTMALGFDYIRKKHNDLPTLLLTDGMTEALDLRGLKQKVLIISNHQECPISYTNGKLKQVVVEE